MATYTIIPLKHRWFFCFGAMFLCFVGAADVLQCLPQNIISVTQDLILVFVRLTDILMGNCTDVLNPSRWGNSKYCYKYIVTQVLCAHS